MAFEHPRQAQGNNIEDTKGEFNFLGEGTLSEMKKKEKENPNIFVYACVFVCVYKLKDDSKMWKYKDLE